MKRILLFSFFFGLILFTVSGCFLKSVHPLFSAKDAVLLDGLDGTYEGADQRWIFASDRHPEIVADLIRQYPAEDLSIDPGDEDSLGIPGYLILYQDLDKPDKIPVLFLGMVGKIGDQHYLNLKLFEIDFGLGRDIVQTHKFNVNTFSRIKLSEEELQIEHLDSDWISDQIVNNRVRIKHELVESEYDDSREILVTASTHELQQFIQKYGNEPEAYQDATTLNRVPYEAE